MVRPSHMFKTFLCLLLLAGLSGCSSIATKNKFYEPITAELRSGNPDGATLMLETAREQKKYSQKDRLLYFIDAGLLNHFSGRYDSSNSKLHLAEQAAEELFTKSISRAAASLLLNDNVLEYAGEDYEILYANIIKALNYIMIDEFDEAFVEVRRANLKLDVLEAKYADAAQVLKRGSPDDTARVELDYEVPKVRFHNDAFARYLSMHMYAADGKYDDARIDHDYLKAAFRDQPHVYDFDMPTVSYRSEDKAILSVVGLAGLAPVKEALSLRIRTDKDLDLIQVLYDGPDSVDHEYGHFPAKIGEDYYFKFAIPVLVRRPSVVSSMRVLVDGNQVGELQLIEDVGNVATEIFNAKKTLIYIRSVARAVAKGLQAHKMKKKADTGGAGGWLKKVLIDVGMDAIENADLRTSQFLPGMIYVGDFEVEPGAHDVRVEFYDVHGNQIGQSDFTDYTVLKHGLNMLEVFEVN